MLFSILFAFLPAYCAAVGSYIPLSNGATGVTGQFIIPLKKISTPAQAQEVISFVGLSKVLNTYNIGWDWHATAVKGIIGTQAITTLLTSLLQLYVMVHRERITSGAEYFTGRIDRARQVAFRQHYSSNHCFGWSTQQRPSLSQ